MSEQLVLDFEFCFCHNISMSTHSQWILWSICCPDLWWAQSDIIQSFTQLLSGDTAHLVQNLSLGNLRPHIQPPTRDNFRLSRVNFRSESILSQINIHFLYIRSNTKLLSLLLLIVLVTKPKLQIHNHIWSNIKDCCTKEYKGEQVNCFSL